MTEQSKITFKEAIIKEQVTKLNDLAMDLAKKGNRKLAIVMLKRAHTLMPSLAHPVANLGLVHFWETNHEEGLKWLRRAVEMDPDNVTYLGNLGTCASVAKCDEDVETALGRAAELDHEGVSARWDLAIHHLKRGNWETGLVGYNTRFQNRGLREYPEFPVPMWKGEDLAGKRIFVQSEQGIGDRILLHRYLAWMRETWPTATVIVRIGDYLANLFWSLTDHGISFVPDGAPWPSDLDYAVWLASLPEIHGTRPSTAPMDPGWLIERLDRDTSRCVPPEPSLPSLKVGICWTGSPKNGRNEDRSIPLQFLLELVEDPRVQLYNFQVGPGHQEMVNSGAEAVVVDLAPELDKEGLIGTALAMREMDLIISVCTSVAHLAGALRLPCWTLLCSDAYWMWGTEETTTPWYPTMRLFRQRTFGDWKPVIEEVKQALSTLIMEKGL